MSQTRSSVHDEERGKEPKGVCSHENCNVSSLSSDILLPATSNTASDDPSTKMWLLSISLADKYDAAMAEGWKADMGGILVYVRLNI